MRSEVAFLMSEGADASLERIFSEGEAWISTVIGEGWDSFSLNDWGESVRELLSMALADTLSFFALMMGAGILCTLLSLFFEGASSEQVPLASGVSLTVELALLCAVATALFPHIETALRAVRSVSDFCEGLLPVFVSTNLLSGMEKSAVTTASAFGILLTLVEEGIEKIALPSLALLLSASLIPSSTGTVLSLGDKLHKFYISTLTLFSVVLSTAFALQNAITVGADRAMLRALRYGVGSMIPIVGQTVAGTLSALSGGVLYVKSTLGVGAFLSLLAIALPPLVRLLLCRLALSLPAMLVGALSEGSDAAFGRVYRTVRHLVDVTLALVALCVALFLFVVILFMKSTVSLV